MLRPEVRLANCQCTTILGLGLGAAARMLQNAREIVEINRHLGMVRSVASLIDRQRTTKKRLSPR